MAVGRQHVLKHGREQAAVEERDDARALVAVDGARGRAAPDGLLLDERELRTQRGQLGVPLLRRHVALGFAPKAEHAAQGQGEGPNVRPSRRDALVRHLRRHVGGGAADRSVRAVHEHAEAKVGQVETRVSVVAVAVVKQDVVGLNVAVDHALLGALLAWESLSPPPRAQIYPPSLLAMGAK